MGDRDFNFNSQDGSIDDEPPLQAVILAHLSVLLIVYLLWRCCFRRCCCPPANGVNTAPMVEVSTAFLQPRKRVFTSYLLWLFGPLSSHHFYLERVVHGIFSLWTLNFFGLGWLLDGLLIPFYVRGFNNQRCAPMAPYDNSRRRILLYTPLTLIAFVLLVVLNIVYLPYILHRLQVVDIDRIAAQTEMNPYDLLDVPRGASLAEAKAGYRRESLRWHPDRNPGCGKRCDDKMSEITKAFDLIKKRRAPVTEDRTWETWFQEVGNDWLRILEVLGQNTKQESQDTAKSSKSDL
jgi:TM2 domain-containing membrane protein YozV